MFYSMHPAKKQEKYLAHLKKEEKGRRKKQERGYKKERKQNNVLSSLYFPAIVAMLPNAC